MRKPLRYGFGIAILAAAGVAVALPWVNGQRAETALRDGVAAMQRQLAADPRSDAELTLEHYRRGPLDAEALIRLRFPESDAGNRLLADLDLPPGPIQVDLLHTLAHGLTGVDIDGRLQSGDLVDALLHRLGGDADSLRIEGHVGLLERRLELATDALEGELDESGRDRVRIEPLTVSARYGATDGAGEIRLAWGGLQLTADGGRSALDIGAVEATAAGTLVAGEPASGLWAGDSQARIASVGLRENGRELGEVRAVELRSESRETAEGRMSARIDWRLGRVRAPQMALAGAELRLSAERLAQEPLLALNKAAPGAPTEAALAGLLEAGPVLRLEGLTLAGADGGRLSLTGHVALSPRAAERSDAVLASGGQALLAHADGELALRVDRAIAASLPPQAAGLLGQLQAFGLLVADGDEARLDIALADGGLTVNGRRWPLP